LQNRRELGQIFIFFNDLLADLLVVARKIKNCQTKKGNFIRPKKEIFANDNNSVNTLHISLIFWPPQFLTIISPFIEKLGRLISMRVGGRCCVNLCFYLTSVGSQNFNGRFRFFK
jgi:hypothetical protein